MEKIVLSFVGLDLSFDKPFFCSSRGHSESRNGLNYALEDYECSFEERTEFRFGFVSYKEETGYKGSFKKYIAEQYSYSQLINELFENFSSDEAYEEYVYVESLSKEVAIERLKKEIAEHRIFYAEEYIEQYGDYEPPF